MGIEFIDKTHARLVVSRGSGKNRQRKVKRITYNGKRDAERQFREFEANVDFGVDSSITVARLLDWYIGEFTDRGGKEMTARGYRIAAKALKSHFGKAKAKDLTLGKIENYISKCDDSPKTIKNRISLLRSAYKLAIRHGMLNYNPCEYAVLPKQQKPEIQILSDSEVCRFVAALDSAPLDFKVACELALFCGLRRSEVMGLQKADVTDTVTVNKVRHRLNRKDIISTTKTTTSTRTLAVPLFVQEDITALLEVQQSRPATSDFLILTSFGEPISHTYIYKHLKALIKKNALHEVTFHGLRHTYASMLINAGIPIAEVSAQLGHASIDITLRTYTHLFADASTASRRISDYLDEKWHQDGHQ